MQICD